MRCLRIHLGTSNDTAGVRRYRDQTQFKWREFGDRDNAPSAFARLLVASILYPKLIPRRCPSNAA